jgi:hypothetical protein
VRVLVDPKSSNSMRGELPQMRALAQLPQFEEFSINFWAISRRKSGIANATVARLAM